MTDDQFDEFVDSCYEELEKKQVNLMDQYDLGRYERYWLNGDERTLDFIENDITEVIFKINYIGTWSHKNDNWMWAWANESMSDQIRNESNILKELKDLIFTHRAYALGPAVVRREFREAFQFRGSWISRTHPHILSASRPATFVALSLWDVVNTTTV
ncbi:DUF6882 domain-containing protein [Paenibacillus sp. YIM B09110]|uniref:DUF6882 domain-containing protein n=1 Tax=Paenibacillus sp. YIM B09110 TaxID=3126102 RepID=UPI00301CB457